MSWSGMLTEARILPVANSITDGMPMPMPLVSSVTEPSIAAANCSTSASWEAWLVETTRESVSVPPSRIATAILVPPTSTPMNWSLTDATPVMPETARSVVHCRWPGSPLRETLRRALVHEHGELAGRRPHVRGGRGAVARVAERALDRLGFVLARDQEHDVARAVDRRQRERDPRDLGLHPGELDARHEPLTLVDLGLAREQRRAVR